MLETWIKYKLFQRVKKGNIQEVFSFVADFDWEYNLAKTAGSVYLDTILAFCLIEVANLFENDDKFVFAAVDLEKENLTDQMRASLKKFQGRALVSSDKEEIKFDSALVIKIKDALDQGWKRPEKQRRQSNSNLGMVKRNSKCYQGQKNLLGNNGKVLKCFNCESEEK